MRRKEKEGKEGHKDELPENLWSRVREGAGVFSGSIGSCFGLSSAKRDFFRSSLLPFFATHSSSSSTQIIDPQQSQRMPGFLLVIGKPASQVITIVIIIVMEKIVENTKVG